MKPHNLPPRIAALHAPRLPPPVHAPGQRPVARRRAGAPLALNLAGRGAAAAQTATDYRAIVCLFMFGGNDAFNMVLPTDSACASRLTLAARARSIALLAPARWPTLGQRGSPARLGGVLAIHPTNPQGPQPALHPLMGACGRCSTPTGGWHRRQRRPAGGAHHQGAVRPPTTRGRRACSRTTTSRATWQAYAPEGATLGWGGRLGDCVAGSNPPVFTAMSAPATRCCCRARTCASTR